MSFVYANSNPVAFVDPLGLYKLYHKEDGRVIAIIEEGDTLGNIAEAEVADRFAYFKMKTWDGSDIPDYDSIVVGEGYDITSIYGGIYPNPNSAAKKSVDVNASSVQNAFQQVPKSGDYDGAYGLQCVDLTRWFIDTYTTLKSTTGNGRDLAANTARANNLSAPVTIPCAPAVFSTAAGYRAFGASGGQYGHTGIVLSVDEANQKCTVLHTWNSLSNKNPRSMISVYSYPVPGVTFTNLGDYLK